MGPTKSKTVEHVAEKVSSQVYGADAHLTSSLSGWLGGFPFCSDGLA